MSILLWQDIKKNELRPHKSQYWLFPKIENEEEFVSRLESIGSLYVEACEPNASIIVTSTDEKTGIQAISHIKTSVMDYGRIKRIDSEYTRNGTTCLMAAKNIASGKISAYKLGLTRTEEDFLEHAKSIVATNPDKEHVIICDQLNTHKSASLVKWIASILHKDIDLGIKGKEGILKSQKTRMKFLENKLHKIRFIYTPKHCSWMNQIENWFGILQTKVIKNGNFDSVNDLEEKIEKFIKYHTCCLAKPMKWKFKGQKYKETLLLKRI